MCNLLDKRTFRKNSHHLTVSQVDYSKTATHLNIYLSRIDIYIATWLPHIDFENFKIKIKRREFVISYVGVILECRGFVMFLQDSHTVCIFREFTNIPDYFKLDTCPNGTNSVVSYLCIAHWGINTDQSAGRETQPALVITAT